MQRANLFPGKLFQSRSKEETEQNKMSGWLGAWRRVFGSRGLMGSPSVKTCAGNTHGKGELLCRCCVPRERSRERLREQGRGSCSSLAPRSLPLLLQTFLPAAGVLRKHRGSFREAQESCARARRGLARGRCGGNVTQRWQCHPARRSCPRTGAAGARAERLGELSAALDLSREKSLFSRAVNPSSPRGFSTFPLPPPHCQSSQMCSVLEAAKFPVPGQGNHSIS